MADVISDYVPKGTEVKWYAGGQVAQISHTVTSGEASAKGFALGGTYLLEYGSVWCTVNDVATAVIENKTDISTAATESTGCDFVKFASLAEGNVVVVYGVDISTGYTLTHIASCKDVKSDTKASSKKEAVHGQSTKLVTVGTAESTATLEALMYTPDFVALVFGDSVVSPATGWKKWSNKTHGFKTIGCLVGKRFSSAGAVVDKFFLIGALANSYGQTFPTEDMYKESFGFDCNYLVRARKD